MARLVDASYKIERQVQPTDRVLRLLVKLFEIETAHILEKIIACIYLCNIEILQLKSFQLSQLLVAQVQHDLSSLLPFLIFFLDFSPYERADFFIRDHSIIIWMSDKNEVDVIIDSLKNFKGITEKQVKLIT